MRFHIGICSGHNLHSLQDPWNTEPEESNHQISWSTWEMIYMKSSPFSRQAFRFTDPSLWRPKGEVLDPRNALGAWSQAQNSTTWLRCKRGIKLKRKSPEKFQRGLEDFGATCRRTAWASDIDGTESGETAIRSEPSDRPSRLSFRKKRNRIEI